MNRIESALQKQEVLDRAKATLKREFIGIDQVIDEVVDAISPWYLFPDLQEKPVVINLWGLTGVGKSSLVNRLAQLIEFEKKYYHFDLGESRRDDSYIRSEIENISEYVTGYPVILALDEFQHARTLEDEGSEIKTSNSHIIWQLLDSGRFQTSKYRYALKDLHNLIQKLQYLLQNGVRVSKGKVISKKEYFIEKMDLRRDYLMGKDSDKKYENGNVLFVPAEYHDIIFSLAREKFSSDFEVKGVLDKLNGYQTLEFLNDIFLIGNSPKSVDCSKALIFVLGNLDEAYTMSHNFNPDMDADEFHQQSLKINVPTIKNALKKRFRIEQIARLGNIHIIYPAFNRGSFQRIIELELSKIAVKYYRQLNIKTQFDQTVHELIYREGVYPTQGIRPIFTTIHQIISTKMGRVITEMILKNLVVTNVVLKTIDDNIIAEYYSHESIIHSLSFRQQMNLENLRKNKRDDVQAITAVHESGHAIISAILLHTVPEVIYSNSAENGKGGFVYTKFKWAYISRKEIINRLALLLGGLAAEKIIFGEDNITNGAESDIEEATSFIMEMLKKCGMGSLPAAYQSSHPSTISYVHDETGAISDEAKSWISKAMSLAERTLKEQELLLLKMSDYLCDNRYMSKEHCFQLLQKFARDFDFDRLIENGDLLFYRKHLKDKVAAMEEAGATASRYLANSH